MRTPGPFVFAALLGVVSAPLLAHDFWIEPSSFRPQPGARISVRLRVGQHLQGDPMPRDPRYIERFAAVGVGGEMEIRGLSGGEPAGYAAFLRPGTYWLVYDSSHDRLQLDAAKFDRYLGEEGLERIRKLRTARRAGDGPVQEMFSRCAKSLIAVGDGSGPGYDKVLGLELELVPERNPYALKPGEELPLRLLYHGKPLAGALLVAIPGGAPDAQVAARSDGSGRAGLRLDRSGLWLVKAVHMVPAPKGSGADWESLWASITFELPTR
jgi:uncharacterized GH25 family protein